MENLLLNTRNWYITLRCSTQSWCGAIGCTVIRLYYDAVSTSDATRQRIIIGTSVTLNTCWVASSVAFFSRIHWLTTDYSYNSQRKIQQGVTMYQNFYYSIFIWSSTCFGRHTAHHQEPTAALAASGSSYVEGCWTSSWWTLSGTLCLTTSANYTSNNLPRMKNQRLPVQFLGSWWWTVCRSKHVELHINME